MGKAVWKSNEETYLYMSKKLTDEELAKFKDAVAESIAQQRSRLLMKHKFIGGVIMHLEMIPVRDKRVRTAMTDGKHVYFDLAFYSDLSDDERLFVLAHEAWHCVYMHMLRRKGRDPQIWNFATDMEINRMLENDHFTPPADVLFPSPSWKDNDKLSAEEMYELLLKEMKKAAKKSKKGSKMPGAGGGTGDQQDDNDSDGDEQDGNGESEAEKKYAKKSGKKGGKLKGQFDDHVYNGEDKDSLKSKKTSDKWGEVGEDPDFHPSVDRQTAERIREMVMNSAERTSRTAGGLPAGLQEYLDKLRKPEINWKEVLAQFVTSCFNGKRRWLPPARRHVYNGIYLQSRRDERIKVTVAVDTSGSCYNDIPKFFGELNGLLRSFGNYELTVIQNDYEISRVDKYDQDNPFPENPEQIQWEGGGGTSFAPPFKWIADNNEEPDCFIFFTDGEEYFEGDGGGVNAMHAPQYPVLWILTKDGNENCASWGQKIKFEHDSLEDDDMWD